ncbi:uncharacterized protein LOC134222297 [Armigeres subalbatus]|uniref:uncharacterized protein LOC134222297 n=1 Tax=Armigeres subalbatus TaxID=124917 RepID=UPI002ED21CA4
MYADGLLIFTKNQRLKNKLEDLLLQRFRIKGLGEATYCLGIRIQRDRRGGKLSLDQKAYIEEIVRRFGCRHSLECKEATGSNSFDMRDGADGTFSKYTRNHVVSNLRLEFAYGGPVTMYCDNQTAISIAGIGSSNLRAKHVSIRYHSIYKNLENGAVTLCYTPISSQSEDGFTKPLATLNQQKFCRFIHSANWTHEIHN